MNKLFSSLLILTGLLANTLVTANELTVHNAWIREAPPVSKVQAAYMRLQNTSDKDISLISASSPFFSSIEFHRTEMNNGLMRMQQEKTLTIPAKGEIRLQPDATHMMLFNPRQALRAGDKVPFTLIFSDQQKISIMVTVKTAMSIQQRQHRCGHH